MSTATATMNPMQVATQGQAPNALEPARAGCLHWRRQMQMARVPMRAAPMAFQRPAGLRVRWRRCVR